MQGPSSMTVWYIYFFSFLFCLARVFLQHKHSLLLVEGLLEETLGCFYTPYRPLTDVTVLQFRDPLSRWSRRFFYHMLRQCLLINLLSKMFISQFLCNFGFNAFFFKNTRIFLPQFYYIKKLRFIYGPFVSKILNSVWLF